LLLMAMRLQQKTAREADCYPDPERAV